MASVQDVPSGSWSLEQLTEYVQAKLGEVESLFRTSAVKTWRLGLALSLVREKLPRGQWSKWQVANKLNRATVNEAIRLQKRYACETELEGLAVGFAKAKAGIRQPSKKAAAQKADPQQNVKAAVSALTAIVDGPALDVEKLPPLADFLRGILPAVEHYSRQPQSPDDLPLVKQVIAKLTIIVDALDAQSFPLPR
jgi:hypothetical protein